MPQLPKRNGTMWTDVRIQKVRMDRVAEGMQKMLVDSVAMGLVIAALASDAVPWFGQIAIAQCCLFLAIIVGGTIGRYLLLMRYYEIRDRIVSLDDTRRWTRYFLALQIVSSVIWGLAPWMLWSDAAFDNHLFIGITMLTVTARYLANRGQHLEFFMASVVPVSVMLIARMVYSFTYPDMIVAALSTLFTAQILLDARQLGVRSEQDIHLRFTNEDMARDLEEARDEALKKRFEAETANASKTAFLANMSHELRTPLNAILGFSEIIARECFGPVGSARYKEYAGDIHNSGAHLLSLINDLLDVAKIEAGRMEIEPHMIEAASTIDNALKLVAVRARERNQALNIAIDPNAGVLYADERALKQILINLVSNAVKFTPNGGQINVFAHRNADGEFEMVVEDNGPGISQEKLDRVFKPFSQIDNRYDREAGGTGLGLALVRGLTELHGGRAWIESEEGKGTKVFVVFPAPPAEKAKPKKAMQA